MEPGSLFYKKKQKHMKVTLIGKTAVKLSPSAAAMILYM